MVSCNFKKELSSFYRFRGKDIHGFRRETKGMKALPLKSGSYSQRSLEIPNFVSSKFSTLFDFPNVKERSSFLDTDLVYDN